MLEYSVKKISEISENDLYNFYKTAFKDRYKILIKNYKWWYRLDDNKCPPIFITLKNKIIGHLATVPIKIKLQETVFSGSFFVDYIVLPEFQGKGVGSILVQEGTKYSEIQIAFCNEAALKIYKKFGWKITCNTKRMIRPINPIKWIPIIKNLKTKLFKNLYNNSLKKKLQIKGDIKPLNLDKNFRELSDNFLKSKIKNSNILELYRDPAWFEWRFYDFPFKRNLKFFEYKGNYAIVHEINLKNVKRLHVIFYFYIDFYLEEEVYCIIAKWAIENDYDLIWTCSANQKLINNLDDVMPNQFLKKITIASYSSNQKIFKNLDKSFENIQASDSDLDILYLR